ncbi:MAG: hypothetical protein AB1489_39095, partial [Acidobacteriota bacterium]
MVWENLKLLFKLYYHPIAAMSELIDQGSLFYSIIGVLLTSLLCYYAISEPLYRSYEFRPSRLQGPQSVALPAQTPNTQDSPITSEEEADWQAESDDYPQPQISYRSAPLPLIGNWGWLFISFSFSSTLSTIIALIVLYVPTVILLITLFEPIGRFNVVSQQHYGALLACTSMAWIAGHLPFALLAITVKPIVTSPALVFALWGLSKLAFAFWMVCAVRVVFGARFRSAIATIALSWITLPFSVLFQSCFYILASP